MNKYHNSPTILNGVRFASKREARRYAELLLLQKAKEIKNLKIHTRWLLLKGDKSRKIRPMYYEDDFNYIDKGGRLIVEDVKGVRTGVYQIKKKIMAIYHNIEITEIK